MPDWDLETGIKYLKVVWKEKVRQFNNNNNNNNNENNNSNNNNKPKKFSFSWSHHEKLKILRNNFLLSYESTEVTGKDQSKIGELYTFWKAQKLW